MFNSVIVLVLCALVAGACEQSLSGTATPTGPSEATVQAATNSTSAGSAGTAVPQAATVAYIDGLGADTLAKAAACTSGSHGLLLRAMEWKASHGGG